jgi:hypothetical protein
MSCLAEADYLYVELSSKQLLLVGQVFIISWSVARRHLMPMGQFCFASPRRATPHASCAPLPFVPSSLYLYALVGVFYSV